MQSSLPLTTLGPLPGVGRRSTTSQLDSFGVTKTVGARTSDAAFKRLLELEAACRSAKLGAQVRAVLEFERLFRQCPFPLVVNTGFLKLTELFRSSPNGLRYFLLQTFFRLRPYLDRVLSDSELARRVLAVLGMTDPLARILALRTLGCLAPRLRNRLDVQHAVLRRMSSTHPIEAAAAIHAADQLCQYSPTFPKTLWLTLVHLINDQRTPDVAKCRLIYILRHMHSDPVLAEPARKLCGRWLNRPTHSELALYVLKTAVHLAAHTLVDVDELVDRLFGYLHPAAIQTVPPLWRREALVCLIQLIPRATRHPVRHLWWLGESIRTVRSDPQSVRLAFRALDKWLGRPDLPALTPSEIPRWWTLIDHCEAWVVVPSSVLPTDVGKGGAVSKLPDHASPLRAAATLMTLYRTTPVVAPAPVPVDRAARTLRRLATLLVELLRAEHTAARRRAIREAFGHLDRLGELTTPDVRATVVSDLIGAYERVPTGVRLEFDAKVFRLARHLETLPAYATAADLWLARNSAQVPAAHRLQVAAHVLLAEHSAAMHSCTDEDDNRERVCHLAFRALLDSMPRDGDVYLVAYRSLRVLAQAGYWRPVDDLLALLNTAQVESPAVALWRTALGHVQGAEILLLPDTASSPSSSAPTPASATLLTYHAEISRALAALHAMESLGHPRRFQIWFLECHRDLRELCRRALFHLQVPADVGATAAVVADTYALGVVTEDLYRLIHRLVCLRRGFPALDATAHQVLATYHLVATMLVYQLCHRARSECDYNKGSPRIETVADPAVVAYYRSILDAEPRAEITTVANSTEGDSMEVDGDGDPDLKAAVSELPADPESPLRHSQRGSADRLAYKLARLLPFDLQAETPPSDAVLCEALELVGTSSLQLPPYWFNSPQLFDLELSADAKTTVHGAPLMAQRDQLYTVKLEGFLQSTDGVAQPTPGPVTQFTAIEILSVVSVQPTLDMTDLDLMANLYQHFLGAEQVPPIPGAISSPALHRFAIHQGAFRGELLITLPMHLPTDADRVVHVHVCCALTNEAACRPYLTNTALTLPIQMEPPTSIAH
ncbi:hypothetical protein IWQ60_010628 [Tieghemiomyces parasiticus]|uniref:Integrator complex subunit 7 N-terminal domain-containing protein n=1 Tax=Tieghemiomyces parasiticus TaxID=78921 RepID=A0A9W7ZL71_9FUNG|nr:hypothetical protein IWQ60_010628 [Tieghemiomyces parasiticus]